MPTCTAASWVFPWILRAKSRSSSSTTRVLQHDVRARHHRRGRGGCRDRGLVPKTRPFTESALSIHPRGSSWQHCADCGRLRGDARDVPQRSVVRRCTGRGQWTCPDFGRVTYDLAFGGSAFYAYVDAGLLAWSWSAGGVSAARRGGRRDQKGRHGCPPRRAPRRAGSRLSLRHDSHRTATNPRRAQGRNVCIFADGEVDRSPTGTGVSGRMAIHHARRVELASVIRSSIESLVGSTFTGTVVETTTVGPFAAVIPEVSGTASIAGRNEFWIDPSDELGAGFLVR